MAELRQRSDEEEEEEDDEDEEATPCHEVEDLPSWARPLAKTKQRGKFKRARTGAQRAQQATDLATQGGGKDTLQQLVKVLGQ